MPNLILTAVLAIAWLWLALCLIRVNKRTSEIRAELDAALSRIATIEAEAQRNPQPTQRKQ